MQDGFWVVTSTRNLHFSLEKIGENQKFLPKFLLDIHEQSQIVWEIYKILVKNVPSFDWEEKLKTDSCTFE